MGQFKSFTGLRTYTVPLQRDLRELERYLKALDARLARLIQGEPISQPIIGGGDPSSALKKHAHTHATGGTTKSDTNTDPITPYTFTWTNAHTFAPALSNIVPLTIVGASSQSADLIFVTNNATTELFEMNSDGQVSIGAPAGKDSALNVKRLSISQSTGVGKDPSELPAIASTLRTWFRTEDITGVADGDVFTSTDPTWADHATTVAGNISSGDALDEVPASSPPGTVVGPKYFSTTDALNGYPIVTRHTDQGLVGFGSSGITMGVNDAFTLIVVYRASSNTSFIMGGNGGSGATGFQFPGNEASTDAKVWNTGTDISLGSTFDNSSGYLGSTDWHIGVFTSNGVSIAYRHDTTDVGSATTETTNGSYLFMARTNAQYSSSQGAAVVEIIFYKSELSAANIEYLENYLIDKYFVSTSDVMQWDPGTGVDGIIKKDTGRVGVGTVTPAAKLDVLATSEQARLSYDGSNYASLTVDASGNLAVALTGTTPESTFADNANFSGEVLITGANGLYFTSKTTGQQIKTGSNDLVITADIDSSAGKVDIEDRVLVTNKSTTEPILQLQATTGSGEAIEVLKSGGDDLFKVDASGFIYGPEGTVAMRIVSQTDNVSAFDKKGAFDFIQDSGADADSYFANFKISDGSTILQLTPTGRLLKDASASTEFLYETGSFSEVTFSSKPTFDSGWLTKKIAEPSTPTSNYGSVFLDTDDNILKIKHDDGTVVNLENGAVATPFDVYMTEKTRNAEDDIHGGFQALSTGDALNSGSPINVTLGIGKLVLLLNAGSDFAGSITVTGTSVNRETGAETGSDTDVITVDALTTDNSAADANGIVEHAITGAYITSKWFRGAVTISTTNLTLTDVDSYQIAFEQANDQTEFRLDTLDFSGFANSTSAWISGYLYSVEVTGSKVDIVSEAGDAVTAAGIDANKWYRFRRGNINKTLDGSKDGFFFDLTLGPGANTYWENINAKVWIVTPLSGVVAVGGAGSFDPSTSYTWTADQTVNDNVKWIFGTGGSGDSYVIWDGTNFVITTGSGAAEFSASVLLHEMTAPGTPASTEVALYVDDVTGNLSVKKDTGSVVDLEAGGGASPLTTKGDIYTYDSADARLPVGTNGHVLTADSAQTLGVKWAAAGAASPPLTPTASKTSAYTAAAGDYVLCDTNTTGAFTVTLPVAATAGSGAQIGCKKTTADVNTLTIDGDGTETIDGDLTKTLLGQYDSIVLLCDGSNWHVIG